MSRKTIICPCCGADITEAIWQGICRNGGRSRKPAQTAARRANMEKLNASYTAEKRRAAAKKRLETLRKRKEG